MGYSTNFDGEWDVSPPLTQPHIDYLKAFKDTRRMRRDETKAAALPDPLRIAVGLSIGHEGSYFVNGDGFKGQDRDDSVLDSNTPPGQPGYGSSAPYPMTQPWAQPGLWCQWEPTEDGAHIKWDGGEKFYEYVEWIEYLIKHFLDPWGYTLNGTVDWDGEESGDIGRIVIEDNQVHTETTIGVWVRTDTGAIVELPPTIQSSMQAIVNTLGLGE